MTGPGTGDVDDFNNYQKPIELGDIPSVFEGKMIRIPTLLDWQNKPEPLYCNTCVPAHSHAVFIINGCYLIKWADAIKEAKRLNGKTD